MATLKRKKKPFLKEILTTSNFINRLNLFIVRLTLLVTFYVLVALFVSIMYNLVVNNLYNVLVQSFVLIIILDFNKYLGGKI